MQTKLILSIIFFQSFFISIYCQNTGVNSSISLYNYNSISKKKELFLIKYNNNSNTKDKLSSFNPHQLSNDSLLKTNIEANVSDFSKRKIIDFNFSDIFPYSSNVKLKVYINGIEHNASGTLISKNIVLTAGHVIYSDKYKWTDSIIVISNNQSRLNKIKSTGYKYYVFKSYVDKINMKYDIGIIVLNEQIGNKVGFLGIGYNSDINFYLKKGFFFHLSYPSKSFIPEESNLYTGKYQYLNYGNFDKYIKKYDWVRYFQSAPKGESGSSFFSIQKSDYIIYGVLSMGISSYVLITKEKFYAIKKIIELNKNTKAQQ
jgi:hypothetical protein